MNSKALEAAAKARYENYAEELAGVKARNPLMSEPWSWDDLPPIPKAKYVADTDIGVAAYLDEAGTPTNEERQFPIQSRSRFITSIPWSMAELAYLSYHRQHPGQSLQRLAERGGFGAEEVLRFLLDALDNGNAVLVIGGNE